MIKLDTPKESMLKTIFLALTILLLIETVNAQNTKDKSIKLAVVGMSHGHIAFILKRPNKDDFKLVGYYDKNQELTTELSNRYNLDSKLIYNDLEKMLDEVKPEAVVAFGSVYDHLAVVEACAPRGINIMVEKPLAVNMEHANKMVELAKKHHIFLLTNYETSWYPTTFKSFEMINKDGFVGKLKRVVINDGHKGPKEIGCDKYFLEWLTDPILNGGGAIVDFGCYGANLITALTKGENPISVMAVTHQFKSDLYPKVDDDATIILSYPNFQCIIQASWNWPFNRKDMEIYGEHGYVKIIDKNDMKVRGKGQSIEKTLEVNNSKLEVYTDPFAYFFDVINNKIKMEPYSLYSLENNLRVVKILDLARESAKTGEKKYF